MRTSPHRFTWDLDKTYLVTEFETVSGLLRAAFEAPEDKRAYPGAPTLLRAIKRRGHHRLHILSGSPRQMRRKLERKLGLDGIAWDRFKLKPNLENVLRGRFHQVREQVGYKLSHLLRWRVRAGVAVTETLVGDDAEADAFVYSLYADLLTGRVGSADLEAVLALSGCHEETAERVMTALGDVVLKESVSRILIHLDQRSPPEALAHFGRRLVPIGNYFQAALVLREDHRIADRDVIAVARDLSVAAGYGAGALTWSVVDLVRRGHLLPGAARRLGEVLQEALGGRRWADLPRLLHGADAAGRWARAAATETPDYGALYERTKGRARR